MVDLFDNAVSEGRDNHWSESEHKTTSQPITYIGIQPHWHRFCWQGTCWLKRYQVTHRDCCSLPGRYEVRDPTSFYGRNPCDCWAKQSWSHIESWSKNIVVLYGTQAKKVYVPYGKHCTEGTMMQQPNPVQAVCNMVDSVELGLGLLSLRRRVYSTGLPKLLQGLREWSFACQILSNHNSLITCL